MFLSNPFRVENRRSDVALKRKTFDYTYSYNYDNMSVADIVLKS